MNIQLSSDDIRLGHIADDGHVTDWPTQDVFGNRYARTSITSRRVDAGHFVVIPPYADGKVDKIEIVSGAAASETPQEFVQAEDDSDEAKG